jgi:hypothetical protein
MTHFIFNQAGSIPGIPGTFAHCRVDIDEAGNVTETPLPLTPMVSEDTEPMEAVKAPVQAEEAPAPEPPQAEQSQEQPAQETPTAPPPESAQPIEPPPATSEDAG